ncbi:MAG: radical SAM protein, partial [Candidatus Aenigmarchaeota archaeon]|nr:radical SAM protein [Candidatus Aenigmarchaeota archaeon]
MKILLIDPPFYRFIGYYNRYFPLGLAYLASVLRKEGHEVLIYDADCNVSPSKMDFTRLEDSYPDYLKSLKDENHPILQEVSHTISNFNPDIVGITVWTTFAASAFKIASLCKEYDRSVPVVMGGPHVSIKYDEVLKICPDVDFLIRGEGEETFLELVRMIGERWGNKNATFNNIKGISYRQNGEMVHNPQREFVKDLDAIPFPARDLLLNKDSYNSEDMGLLMTSRGCPYNCSYCATGIWKRKVRYRSVDNIIKEIKFLIDAYGTKQFTFKDDSFTVNKKRVLELCDRLIKEKININWDCNTRVNLINEDLLSKMKKAGCNSIKVGIETGSEKILKLMRKGITFEQCRKSANLFRKVGIHWTGYFMMGLPSETKEEVYQTLKFMKELKPDFASFSVYEPFPGTELFEIGIKKGLVQDKRTLEDFYTLSPKYYYVKDITRRVD